MTPGSHVPIRMCMGCGGRVAQAALLRVALAPQGALQVVRGAPMGRTGYLHRQPECWERFMHRKGPLRSLGGSVDKAVRMSFVQELQRAETAEPMR